MLEKLLSRLFKRMFVFVVKVSYKDKNDETVFSFVEYVGLEQKNDIINLRVLAKATSIEKQIKEIPPMLLCNGHIEVLPLTFLGWLHIPKKLRSYKK